MREFVLLMPEIFLAVTLVGIVMSEIGYHGERTRLISATALIGLGGALLQTLMTYQMEATRVFSNALAVDGLSLFFKIVFILLAALAVVGSARSREISPGKRAEYCTLLVASALSMCIVASATNMLLAFMALQFMNVLGYFLSGFGRRSLPSTEAAVKHLAFGAVAGALLLFGVALLFASTQALNLTDMHAALLKTPLNPETALVVFMLMFLSFCFQFGAFPMSLWTPDVLEGAPTPSAAFISLGARAAGFALALRFMIAVFAQPVLDHPGQWQVLGGVDWPRIVALVAGMTMVFGALLAFRQTGAKRLVAYLVVAEAGFLLMGLLVLDEIGVAAILYNIAVELFALVGVFYVLSFLYDELQSDRLQDLKGMLGRAVPECIALVLFLACFVGLPPFAGFIGKFALIGAAIRHEWYFLAGLAILSRAICTVAVARLAFSLIGDFRNQPLVTVAHDGARRAFLGALFVPMILVGVFADRVLGWAGASLRFILW